MTDSENSADDGFIEPSILDQVTDFVDQLSDPKGEAEEWRVGLSHPIVLALEAILESVSEGVLGYPIIGSNPASLKDIKQALKTIRKVRRQQRKKPDRVAVHKLSHKQAEAFDDLLMAAADIIENVSESQYENRDQELDSLFYTELVPAWLDALRNWSADTGSPSLKDAVRRAHDKYAALQPIMDDRFGTRSR